ncbi:MAG: DUF4962 domain-containing protein [Armatimonadota bacterium]
MRELMAVALVLGPFSGVDYERLLETPILGSEALLSLSAAELAEHGQGMTVEQRDGEPVMVTGEGFFLEFTLDLQPGMYSLRLECSAPGSGSDSLWLVVDGERQAQPILPPVGPIAERSGGFGITEGGAHKVRLELREAPGATIRRLSLRRNTLVIPQEPMLAELAGQHPRLYFTADDIPAMRARLQDPRVRRYYEPASVLTRTPPAFDPNGRNGGAFRSLPNTALSYVLEPTPEKLAGIITWLEMATTYPHCGVDLDAEYFMEGVALTYDWLYHDLPPDLRARLRDTIVRQVTEVYNASLVGHAGGQLNFQQNHYWYSHLALILGAAAVYGEVPEAREWLAWGWDRAERIFLTFSSDGAFHEGPAYWDFSMPTLYMLVDLYERCTGLTVPWADAGLRGQAVFRFHHMYPGMRHSATLEDTTVPGGRPPVRLLLWEAKRFEDPVAQGIADLLNPGPAGIAFNFLWLDEGVPPGDPRADVPTAQYYPDVETAFARTSWADDATWVALVSRPLGGHFWAEMCERYGLSGTGHNHPEQGHFMIFGRGEVLAHDPGYTYEKKTRNHNTILVDGQGQYGDGEMWPGPKPGRASMTGFVSEGPVTIMAADPCSAYPPELGLTRFERTLALAGEELVVVCDRLAAEQPRTFSWLLHHIGEVEAAGNACRITRRGAQLSLVALQPAQLALKTERYLPQYVHPTRDHTPDEDAEIGLVALEAGPVAQTTFLVPMVIGAAGDALPPIEAIGGEGWDGVRVGETVVAFRGDGAEMVVPLPWGETHTTGARAVVAMVRDGERLTVELP